MSCSDRDGRRGGISCREEFVGLSIDSGSSPDADRSTGGVRNGSAAAVLGARSVRSLHRNGPGLRRWPIGRVRERGSDPTPLGLTRTGRACAVPCAGRTIPGRQATSDGLVSRRPGVPTALIVGTEVRTADRRANRAGATPADTPMPSCAASRHLFARRSGRAFGASHPGAGPVTRWRRTAATRRAHPQTVVCSCKSLSDEPATTSAVVLETSTVAGGASAEIRCATWTASPRCRLGCVRSRPYGGRSALPVRDRGQSR